jgi:uncharacterized protein (TIGR03067 family)
MHEIARDTGVAVGTLYLYFKEYVPSPTLDRLQGDWRAVTLVRDGQASLPMVLATGRRHAVKNEVKIVFGGQVVIHALVRIDDTQDPIHVDYSNIGGMATGARQEGIMKWVGEEACFCMAAPELPRPAEFESTTGSGRTPSQWQRKGPQTLSES